MSFLGSRKSTFVFAGEQLDIETLEFPEVKQPGD